MSLDEQLFLFLNHALSGSILTPLFTAATRFGNGLVLAALIIPWFYLFDKPKFRLHALPMILAVAISGGVANLLKIAVDRPRPAEHFQDSDVEVITPRGTPSDRSFPSGHTQTAFGAAVYLSCLYPGAAPLFMAAALIVGLSRISLGVHFPLDVLVGAMIGGAFSTTGFYIRLKISARKGASKC